MRPRAWRERTRGRASCARWSATRDSCSPCWSGSGGSISGARARALARPPFTVAYACHFAAGLYQWRREPDVVQELEDAALAHDTEHGFGLFLTAGAIQRGWLLCERGRSDEGLAQMRDGLARHREIGAEVLVPAFLGLVAEVCAAVGRPAEGLSAVTEALAATAQSGQYYWQAELHRLRGVLLLQTASDRGRDAEKCLREAIEIARRQNAKSLELRAGMSLSRLRARRGTSSEGLALLAATYRTFTEGFATADLRDADELLRGRRES